MGDSPAEWDALSWGCMRHGLLCQTRSSQNSSGLCHDD
jgi:hypothetical protein